MMAINFIFIISTIFILMFSLDLIHGDNDLVAGEKICGARSLSYKLLESNGVWIRSKTEYYSSCKFIHARYNCTRFSSTSSTDYHISFNPSTAFPCQVPNDLKTMQTLIERQVQPV